jgi:alpha-1,6-mannosyltransferase
MARLTEERRAWAWGVLGLAGSVLVALCAPRALHDGVVGWWYAPSWPGRAATALIYVGMAALAVAWVGLGRHLPGRRTLLAIAALWLLPLALAPPLFTRDLYSYLAQGTILHLGHNPYHVPPTVLTGLGRAHMLAAVSPFWRHTTAPYGPLFLELVSLVVGIAGSHLIAGVLLARALELVGIVLLAVFVPRLTRALGTDACRGLWLTVASPLTALGLVAAGHNDLLMAGLLAAGVAVALEGRPLYGVAVCALAATIKVPALVGAVFIAVAWARAADDRPAALRLLAGAAVVAAAVLAVVTVASGVGVSWLSASLFSTPAKVRLAITPGTSAGYTVAAVMHALGISVSSRGMESAVGDVAFAIAAVVGLVALWRVRVDRLVALLGLTLLVAAAGGPAAWPWYFIWGLLLVAAVGAGQRSRALVVALVVSAFLVKPNGVLAIPLGAAPVVLIVYLVIAGVAWNRWRRHSSGVDAAHPEPALPDNGTPPALART